PDSSPRSHDQHRRQHVEHRHAGAQCGISPPVDQSRPGQYHIMSESTWIWRQMGQQLSWSDSGGYCQLDTMIGLFALKSGEEGQVLGPFFAKNQQKNVQTAASWR